MLPIDKNYSMSYKNGYFVTHKMSVYGEESKTPGEQYCSEKKTYPNLLKAWWELKKVGVDSDKILAVGEQLVDAYQEIEGKKAGREFLTKLETKKEVLRCKSEK